MKKTIRIDIHYDCDFLNITTADLMAIQNEVLNQRGIEEDVAEGRFEIDAKIVEPINEQELDELAEEYFLNTYNKGITDPNLDIINEKKYAVSDFKAGYRKALEQNYDFNKN